MDITVEFISGEYSGRKFKFSSSSILVGRSADADLSLPFDIVSYEHCRFTIKADGRRRPGALPRGARDQPSLRLALPPVSQR